MNQFTCLNIPFYSFLQMAFLYQDLEKLLDNQEYEDKTLIAKFSEEINSIHADLYKIYPYNYF